MSSFAAHSDYSDEDEDFSSLYSGAAKRFKKEKQKVGCTRQVGNNKEIKFSTSASNVLLAPAQQIDDSSDDEILRDPNRLTQEVDLDETEVEEDKQVETLEDIEECINISPEVSLTVDQKDYSSASKQAVNEVECEEDPLFCAPLNDSQLYQTLDDNELVVVKVRFIAQKVWRIELKRADYFKTISQKLSESTDVDAGKIILCFNDQRLNDYDSLKTVPLGISDIIDASVCKGVVSSNETMLELKVQSQNRNAQVVVSMRPEDPMEVLMLKYAKATGIDLSKLKFKFDGENLEEDDTPSSLELEGGECIDVFITE